MGAGLLKLFCLGFGLFHLCVCRLHDLRQIAAQLVQLAFIGLDRALGDSLCQWLLFNFLQPKGQRAQLCLNLGLFLVYVIAQRF